VLCFSLATVFASSATAEEKKSEQKLEKTSVQNTSPTVMEFGPVGLQRDVRQVRLRFNAEMAALGDNKALPAADIQCDDKAAQAKGRWTSANTWVGEFEKALPDGVRCTVKPHALTSLQAQKVADD